MKSLKQSTGNSCPKSSLKTTLTALIFWTFFNWPKTILGQMHIKNIIKIKRFDKPQNWCAEFSHKPVENTKKFLVFHSLKITYPYCSTFHAAKFYKSQGSAILLIMYNRIITKIAASSKFILIAV